mmetsp:Transcript_40668/g.99921  ORF Transcript_40668/g.99921 Transcript_40668/m.99921 type:complete len:226 (+) Transcript_40668:114-791(+)
MDYNLGDKKKCLIGNWTEEHSLKEYAGHYRTADTPNKTHVRCIEHSVRYDPKELSSSHNRDFSNPKDPLNPLVYKPQDCLGAREKLIRAKLKALQELPPEKELPAERVWETTHTLAYTQPSDDPQYKTSVGARRMRTQDNVPSSFRDRTWLLEHNIAATHICLETKEGTQRESELAARGVPVTVYSTNVGQFPCSNPTEGANPYSRHSAFSQPIEHYYGTQWKDL